MYYTFPDAALQQARRPAVTLPADAWLYSNRKVYICAWERYFPDRLTELFGRPYPPCWKCYQNRLAEAKAKGTAQAEAEKSARHAAASRINRNGWIKQPRPFVDIDGRHYVYSPIYRCRRGCESESCRPGLKGGGLPGDLTAHWTVHIVLIVIERHLHPLAPCLLRPTRFCCSLPVCSPVQRSRPTPAGSTSRLHGRHAAVPSDQEGGHIPGPQSAP